MSRTRRKEPHKFIRHPKTKNTLRGEQDTCMDLREDGFVPEHRHVARSSRKSGKIKTAWDDQFHNYWYETPTVKHFKKSQVCRLDRKWR